MSLNRQVEVFLTRVARRKDSMSHQVRTINELLLPGGYTLPARWHILGTVPWSFAMTHDYSTDRATLANVDTMKVPSD